MKKYRYDMSKLPMIDESGYLPKKVADKYKKEKANGESRTRKVDNSKR